MELAQVQFLSMKRDHKFEDEWYEYADLSHFWIQWRFKALLNLLTDQGISTQKSKRTLDIGGGCGVLASQVESNTEWNVDIADLNHKAIENALKTKGEKYYYDITEKKSEMIEKYDSVFLFDVIEHLTETQAFIRASVEHIKPGGLLLVNVPALSSLFSRYDTALGHIRRYSKTTLAQEFQEAGVEILEVRYWGFTMIPLLFLRKMMLAVSISGNSIVRSGFEPPSKTAEKILLALMRFELRFTRRPFLGSSLLLIARRKA